MASSTLIQPNVNVDKSGSPMKIPSASDIADGTYDWACAILEVVAARLHHESGGNTSSTTTVGLIADICCLYLTSQNNDNFAGIEAKQIKEWIDEISKVDYAAFLNTLNLGGVYELSEQKVKNIRAKASRKEEKALINNINFVYYNLYPSFLRLMRIKKELPEAFTYVKNLINKVQVINNDDLVPSGTVNTGLHGEGRFVRYCYIKYVTDLSLLNTLSSDKLKIDIVEPKKYFGDKLQPMDFMPQVGTTEGRYHLCMAKLRKDTQIRVMKIFVASSQGTCKGCQEMLTELSIAHNKHRYSHEARSPNWIDPFTWKDSNSDSKPAPYMSATVLGKKAAEFLAEEILEQEKLKEEMKAQEAENGKEVSCLIAPARTRRPDKKARSKRPERD
jgi:hypothetical protein